MAAKKTTPRAAKAKRSKASYKKAKATRAKRPAAPKGRTVASRSPNAARLTAELRDSIERDIAERTKVHQADVQRLKVALRPDERPPLVILAHGDSWFDYPCHGNTYTPLSPTDIVVQLGKMGTPPPKILNLSHYGDATTDEMGLAKQQRLIKALSTPANWLSGQPDAILFSGGGNDIAGDPFCIYLNYQGTSSPGLDPQRFAGRLDSIQASYLDLFLFRTRWAQGVPIFGHCYDYGQPMQPHPPCAGPWLLPGLTFTGWNPQQGAQILHDALDKFEAILLGLESYGNGQYNFTVVKTLNTLSLTDWANELHPHPGGFVKLAQKFLAALQSHFPGRI
jgi:hypothetical protein